MSRKKRIPKDAKPVTVYLGGTERLILDIIEVRRQDDNQERDSPSEIVSDALRKFLVDIEGMPIEQIEALRRPQPEDKRDSNLKRFPKKRDKIDR